MRPPVAMAQTAITLDEISGHRLVLGLGCGHRIFGEWMLGATYSASIAPVREYLGIVTGLIREGEVSVTGSWFSGRVIYGAPRRAGLPVYMGSVGPRMLELAAEMADGVILWMCTPGYVRDFVMPRLRAGWARRPGGTPASPCLSCFPPQYRTTILAGSAGEACSTDTSGWRTTSGCSPGADSTRT